MKQSKEVDLTNGKKIKMWLFNKKEDKQLLKSQEFELLLRKFSEIATQTEILKAQLAAMDTKIEAYRLEVKNVSKKARQIAEEMRQEDIENNISNEYPRLL